MDKIVMSQHDLRVLAKNPRNLISQDGNSIFPPPSPDHTSGHVINKVGRVLVLEEWDEFSEDGWIPSNDILTPEQWEAAE